MKRGTKGVIESSREREKDIERKREGRGGKRKRTIEKTSK